MAQTGMQLLRTHTHYPSQNVLYLMFDHSPFSSDVEGGALRSVVSAQKSVLFDATLVFEIFLVSSSSGYSNSENFHFHPELNSNYLDYSHTC